MRNSQTHPRSGAALLLALAAVTAASPVLAHEAWLLTPDEIEALAAEPIPWIFRNHFVLFGAAAIGAFASFVGLGLERRFETIEARLVAPIAAQAATISSLVLRLGLAVMLVLAGIGGLPRHGTALWTQPTLLVPDMQLSLVPGWEWLATAQIAVAGFLVLGLATRIAGLALVGLSLLGLFLFGMPFLSYAPHFAAPGLMIAAIGGGALSLDRIYALDPLAPPANVGAPVWTLARVMVGAGFVYLSVAYKLTQPTLLIAILEHGEFPAFGLTLPVIALVMMGVEIVCGTLLVFGRLTRPVAVLLIGAISFLAITLGETPLFHANLIGLMAVFLLTGRDLPTPDTQTIHRRAQA